MILKDEIRKAIYHNAWSNIEAQLYLALREEVSITIAFNMKHYFTNTPNLFTSNISITIREEITQSNNNN